MDQLYQLNDGVGLFFFFRFLIGLAYLFNDCL